MKPIYWVVIALALIIVGMILFDKDPEPVSTQKWKDEITKKEERIKVLQGNLATIREKVKADSLQGVKSKQEYEVKVTSLRSTVAKLKANPIVIKVREENPEIDSLIVAQDSTILAKDERIVALEADIKRVVANMDSFNDTYEGILQAEREKFEAQKEITAAVEKELKKEKRKAKLAKVLIPVVGVGALLLGAQL